MAVPQSEQLGPAETYADVARSVLRKLESVRRRDGTCVVGIDGHAGVGKSSLRKALVAEQPGIVGVSVDHFHQPASERDRLESGLKIPGFDFELDRIREQVLEPLRNGEPAQYQYRNFLSGELGNWRVINRGQTVVVDGVYSLHEQLRDFYDLRILLTAPESVSLERAESRVRENEIDFEIWRPKYLKEWFPQWGRYFIAQRLDRAADLIIDTELIQRPVESTVWGE